MPKPTDAYREGYEQGRQDSIAGNVAESVIGVLRDDPDGHFAAGYRDGTAGADFNPPIEKPMYPSRSSTSNDRWAYVIFLWLFWFAFLPFHTAIALFRKRLTQPQIVLRMVLLGVWVVGAGFMIYDARQTTASHRNMGQSQPVDQSSATPSLVPQYQTEPSSQDRSSLSSASGASSSSVLPVHQPCGTFPPPVNLNLTSSPNWSITGGETNGNGTWKQRPLLTVNGVDYSVFTPQHAVHYLTDLKLAGGSGDLDGAIHEFTLLEQEFFDCPKYSAYFTPSQQVPIPKPGKLIHVPEPNFRASRQPQVQTFEATHKHGIGGCQGQLELGDSLIFRPYQGVHSFNYSKAQIQAVDDDGIKDVDGKKWHFKISGMTSGQVHMLLSDWLTGK